MEIGDQVTSEGEKRLTARVEREIFSLPISGTDEVLRMVWRRQREDSSSSRREMQKTGSSLRRDRGEEEEVWWEVSSKQLKKDDSRGRGLGGLVEGKPDFFPLCLAENARFCGS